MMSNTRIYSIIPHSKINFSNHHLILNFLLDGIEILLEREDEFGLGTTGDENKEERIGRHLAGIKLSYLKNTHYIEKEKLEVAISMLYRDHPNEIAMKDIYPSFRGYLSRLEEEFKR